MQPPRPNPDADLRRRLAETVPEADRAEAWAAYEDARLAGLCHEGAWEAALGAATADHACRDTMPGVPTPPNS